MPRRPRARRAVTDKTRVPGHSRLYVGILFGLGAVSFCPNNVVLDLFYWKERQGSLLTSPPQRSSLDIKPAAVFTASAVI